MSRRIRLQRPQGLYYVVQRRPQTRRQPIFTDGEDDATLEQILLGAMGRGALSANRVGRVLLARMLFTRRADSAGLARGRIPCSELTVSTPARSTQSTAESGASVPAACYSRAGWWDSGTRTCCGAHSVHPSVPVREVNSFKEPGGVHRSRSHNSYLFGHDVGPVDVTGVYEPIFIQGGLHRA